MQIIAADTSKKLAYMLNGFDCPVILVTSEYQILAANQLYLDNLGEID